MLRGVGSPNRIVLMNKDIEQRWAELHRELQDLAEGKVLVGEGDPCLREDEIQEELDRLEFQAGAEWMGKRPVD